MTNNATQKYLEMLKAKHDGKSVSKIAVILEISQQAASAYQTGRRQMNDENAAKVAKELGLDPVKVYAEVQLETAKSPASRQIWERVLNMANAAPAVSLLGLFTVLPMIKTPKIFFNLLYIM